jgi:hypothetical protein
MIKWRQNKMEHENGRDETGLSQIPADKSLSVQMDEILQASMQMARFSRQIVEKAVQITSPRDWVDQSGHPYLTEAGGMKVASVLPVSIWCTEKPCKTWQDDDKGRFYIYQCEYGAAWKGGLGSVTAIGTASSRDKLLGTVEGEDRPLSEIDETNILKKCGTNGRHNAIVRLLGLQNLSWEQVESWGIDKSKVVSVERNGKRTKKDDKDPEKAEKYRSEIRRMIMEMNGNDPKMAEEHLQRVTSFAGSDGNIVKGKRNVKHLSEKAAKVNYGKVKDEYEAWLKKPRTQQLGFTDRRGVRPATGLPPNGLGQAGTPVHGPHVSVRRRKPYRALCNQVPGGGRVSRV